MTRRRNWSREETIFALFVYKKYGLENINRNSPDIIKLSSKIDRTPSSFMMKVANLKAADINDGSGLHNYSSLDKNIMKEYNQNQQLFEKQFLKIENEFLLKVNKKENFTYLIVDHGSGSYNIRNIGFELFNETKNPIDGKFYAYVPPHNSLDIAKLGANDNDTSISNIPVFLVRKVRENTTDRVITGVYPKAKIYNKSRSGENLRREFLDHDKSLQISPYIIESEDYISTTENNLIIESKKFNSNLFRGQRVYSGTYSELDVEMQRYFKRIIFNEELVNESLLQEKIDTATVASDEVIKNAPNKDIEIVKTKFGKTIKRNASLSKTAIAKANYKCEIDITHKTFLNKNNENYMEGHHLIPLTLENGIFFYEKHSKNIDCVENIISLCPNCHKAIHLGNPETVKVMIEKLYNSKFKELEKIGITITLNELFRLYNVL